MKIEYTRGYEVKNDFFPTQSLYFVSWHDIVIFLSSVAGYDTTIKSNVAIPKGAKKIEWKGVEHMWGI